MAKKIRKYQVSRKLLLESMDEIITGLEDRLEVGDMTFNDIQDKFEELVSSLTELRNDLDAEVG